MPLILSKFEDDTPLDIKLTNARDVHVICDTVEWFLLNSFLNIKREFGRLM